METSNIDIQPIFAPTIHNEILNGNITYSRDIEGKDLPQGLCVCTHCCRFILVLSIIL